MLEVITLPLDAIIHKTKVDFCGKIVTYTEVHIVQYDDSLPFIEVTVYNDGILYKIPAYASIKLRFSKPDGTFIYTDVYGCDETRTKIYVQVTEQMTYFYGKTLPILEMIVNGEIAGSTAFVVVIDKNPVQIGDIESYIVMPFAPVAITGNYNDLTDKIRPDNVTTFIDENNIIHAIAEIPSDLPTKEYVDEGDETSESNAKAYTDSKEESLKDYTDTSISSALQTSKTYTDTIGDNLQDQIDAITSSSDVVDVVGTKEELNNYDTSKLRENDIIKVLQDESRSNAITYYRWTNNVFNYVGSQGPFYTKEETDEITDDLQDQITGINNSVVHKSGAENISGVKSFTNGINITGKINNLTLPNGTHTLATLDDIPHESIVNDSTVQIKMNGSIKGSFTTNQDNDSVIDLGTIPDTNTSHTHTAGSGLKISGNGGVTGNTEYSVNTDYVTNNKNYKVQVDTTTGGLYVNVPWDSGSDTNYYHIPNYDSGLKIATGSGLYDMYVPNATATQKGATTVGSAGGAAAYDHNHDNDYLGIHDTAYDSDRLNGEQPSYYLDYDHLINKPTIPGNDNQTVKVGTTTFNINAAVNFIEGTNVTIAANSANSSITINSTDTRNTAGSMDTSSKIFLVGATSQSVYASTYSHDTAYVGTDGCLYSGGAKVLTAHQDISGKENTSNKVTSWSTTTTDAHYPSEKLVKTALDAKQNTINASNKLSASYVSGLATVATSGSYNDLSNKPTIGNGKLIFKQGLQQLAVFTANYSGDDITINIPLPEVTTDRYHSPAYSSGLKIGTAQGASSLFPLNDMYIPTATSSQYGVVKLGVSGGAATYEHDHDGDYLPLHDTADDSDRLGGEQPSYYLDYDHLINTPTIPTVYNSIVVIKQGGVQKGSFTLNQNGNEIIELDSGGSNLPQYMVLGYNLVTNAKQYTMPNGVKFGPETISPSGTYRVYQDRNGNPITSEADIKAYLKVMTGSEAINYYNQQNGADSFIFMLSDKTCWKFQRNASDAYVGPNQLWAWRVFNFPFPTIDDIPIACTISDIPDIWR